MRKEEFKLSGRTYIRVDSRKARKLFEAGRIIAVAPVLMRIPNPWMSPMIIWKTLLEKEFGRTYDSVLNEYACYNCNSEMGQYLKFFVEVEEVK